MSLNQRCFIDILVDETLDKKSIKMIENVDGFRDSDTLQLSK